jgi:hypothetical protein
MKNAPVTGRVDREAGTRDHTKPQDVEQPPLSVCYCASPRQLLLANMPGAPSGMASARQIRRYLSAEAKRRGKGRKQ